MPNHDFRCIKKWLRVFMTRTAKIISHVGCILCPAVPAYIVSPQESLKCQKETNSVAQIRRGCSWENCASLSSTSQAEEASLASGLTCRKGWTNTIQYRWTKRQNHKVFWKKVSLHHHMKSLNVFGLLMYEMWLFLWGKKKRLAAQNLLCSVLMRFSQI